MNIANVLLKIPYLSCRQSSSISVLWSNQSTCRVPWYQALFGWVNHHMENAGIYASTSHVLWELRFIKQTLSSKSTIHVQPSVTFFSLMNWSNTLMPIIILVHPLVIAIHSASVECVNIITLRVQEYKLPKVISAVIFKKWNKIKETCLIYFS